MFWLADRHADISFWQPGLWKAFHSIYRVAPGKSALVFSIFQCPPVTSFQVQMRSVTVLSDVCLRCHQTSGVACLVQWWAALQMGWGVFSVQFTVRCSLWRYCTQLRSSKCLQLLDMTKTSRLVCTKYIVRIKSERRVFNHWWKNDTLLGLAVHPSCGCRRRFHALIELVALHSSRCAGVWRTDGFCSLIECNCRCNNSLILNLSPS